MPLTTEQEYWDALDRFCRETVALAKTNRAQLFPLPAELQALEAEISAYQDSSDLFRVVCIKGFYAGQGTDWEPGDLYEQYHTRREAESILRTLNREGSWGEGCWELVVIRNQDRVASKP